MLSVRNALFVIARSEVTKQSIVCCLHTAIDCRASLAMTRDVVAMMGKVIVMIKEVRKPLQCFAPPPLASGGSTGNDWKSADKYNRKWYLFITI